MFTPLPVHNAGPHGSTEVLSPEPTRGLAVLLTGASGFVGCNLAQALIARGHTVRPVSRRHGVDMGRLLSPEDWRLHLIGVDAVVNAAGIIGQSRTQRFDRLHTQAPVALFRACEQAGIRRVVQISALGADEAALTDFHRSKRAADTTLLGCDLDGTVLRPGLVYGAGGTSAAFLLRVAAWPWIPVLDAGDQPLQPLHISDLVDTVLALLSRSATTRAPSVLDVVGPRTLTFADWMQCLRAAQGLPPGRLLPVPLRVARPMLRCLQALIPLASPDSLVMLGQGRCADGRAVEQWLGRPLRSPQAHLQFLDAAMQRSDA